MATPVKRAALDEILVRRGLISQDQAEDFRSQANGADRSFRCLLLEHNVVAEEALAEIVAEQYGLRYDPLKDFRVDLEFFKTIPVELMHRHLFVPLEENDGVLTIAVTDPQDLRTLDELELLIGREFRLVVSTRSAILEALNQSEGNSQVITRIQEEFRPVLIREDAHGDEVLSIEKIAKDLSPVVKLVDTMILSALQKRASDIHIEASERAVEIKYRIDGILYTAMEPLDIKFHAPLISRLKVMSELDIAERRIPQDGRFKLRLDQKKVDFRVSVLPSAFGESVVIRILEKEDIGSGVRQLRLDGLGFNTEDLRRFRRAITEPYGMVLVTGPTGSGKTTTLYGAINEINNQEDKIITIEDPVEYQLKGIVQIPVNEKKGLTFARGLRSILRHDPDKIMVGEIRDAETAQIAIQSALTGHLVFSTVHANNAFDVIGRFVNMGIEPYNFVASLNCILAQRLVRAICPACKIPVAVDRAQCEESGLDYDQVKHLSFHQGKGCPECNGLGYRGRRAITEFLALTDRIKEMILDRKPASELRKEAIAGGMTSLREAGIEKVLHGETTLKEVNRVTFSHGGAV
ncbi:MAG: pilus assembly protein PilB [Nitrospirae bacterium 13_1_20CM_2_62_14]|nr:MAG: pilus assembly protein PilB [Nitrospirae bacterium 13_1_40CM_4_62_6]OLC82100.1 MAG: pilus assembly protein PilB [Nitrospirae bacterium 13_1_40CM_3_62_11]OLD37619.1 MAG: pilus assembly protein PilB [Nitrospirae bacterium 13_1_40CM_2_62_10]OLE42118.1 MAG: pilus assembly protein PilB [Nitrospirae bacterium 13_1_20CM_2_62_14]